MLIRHATADDAEGCLEIYGPFAAETATSFEADAPSVDEFRERIERIGRTHAFLVAEDAQRVAGFAYGDVHRTRQAYQWATEVSVYLHPDHRGKGIGRTLYETLFALLGEQGYRMLLAGIALPNEGSVRLHRSLGFTDVGTYRRIGWKAGAWRDVLWLTLQIGPDTDDPLPPPPPGLPVRLVKPIEV